MNTTTTKTPDLGLSPAELRRIFPKLHRRPSYRAKSLRRHVAAFATSELALLAMKGAEIDEQAANLGAWLRRQKVTRIER